MAKKKSSIVNVSDKSWDAYHTEWQRNRAVYKGGDSFIDSYLVRHKAEGDDDFERRLKLSFDPSSASSAVDKVLDTITAGLWNVERSGHDEYEEWVDKSVCGYNCPMSHFISANILPEFAIAGEVFILLDKAEGSETPYCYVIPREDIKLVEIDGYGIKLILYTVNKPVMDEFGLPSETEQVYFLWKREIDSVTYEEYADNGKKISEGSLPFGSIPIAYARIKRPLLTAIARIQIAHLNLNSQDISFLVRSNFPIYVEQYDPKAEQWSKRFAGVPHSGSERNTTAPVPNIVNPDGSLSVSSGGSLNTRAAGIGTGIRYPAELESPHFINPSPECVEVSIEKQQMLKEEIANALNSTVMSLTRAAVMQSAASKIADSTGVLQFSEFMSWTLEALEKAIAAIFYLYQGLTGEAVITYPEYTDVTEEETKLEPHDEGYEKPIQSIGQKEKE